jgi:hypothetical protein
VPALYRSGLLDGQAVAFVSAGELGGAAADACGELGASVTSVDAVAHGASLPDPLHTLVVDAASLFAEEAGDGLEPLRAAADGAWSAVRTAGVERMIPAGGGKIVVLAPGPSRGPHAEAARSALENLARTLSIEWARHQVCITTIHPGGATAPDEVASLVAYLASPGGDYFSGCLISMGEA